MPLIDGVYAPNGPNLIAPELFGEVGAETAQELRALTIPERLRPDVILVATPHWLSPGPFLVHRGERPRQIYDFSGFPQKLSEEKYEPRGDPTLANLLVARGQERKLAVTGTTDWGLDHGAWAPLMHLSPDARVPVVPLSISSGSPLEHLAWGAAIGSVLSETQERVVFVSTGSITHSFSRMRTSAGSRWPQGEKVEKEIVDLLLQREYEAVANFDPRKWAMVEPEGNLGPLFIMAGAMGKSFQPRLVSTYQVWGAFGLTTLEFSPP